jgi:hypothetical protein
MYPQMRRAVLDAIEGRTGVVRVVAADGAILATLAP